MGVVEFGFGAFLTVNVEGSISPDTAWLRFGFSLYGVQDDS